MKQHLPTNVSSLHRNVENPATTACLGHVISNMEVEGRITQLSGDQEPSRTWIGGSQVNRTEHVHMGMNFAQ